MFAGYNGWGQDRGLVWVETSFRRGIPAMDIVGLPGGAIREARDRIRAAVRATELEFPAGHILVSLSPAGVPKTRACLDLAMALAILVPEAPAGTDVLVMGELTLSGRIRTAEGALPALMEARACGVDACILPSGNRAEALALPLAQTFLVDTLQDAAMAASWLAGKGKPPQVSMPSGCRRLCLSPAVASRDGTVGGGTPDDGGVSLSVLARNPGVLAGMVIAAAGSHHALLYGPPGTGKTMASRFLESLLPPLDEDDFLEVNRLYSLAGLHLREGHLVDREPVRRPHHGSSAESLLGSRNGTPGEISLAHRGVLVLDECPEFQRSLLQGLREPMDDGMIRLGRVDHHLVMPADCTLLVTMNSCPCGKLGTPSGTCTCNPADVFRYWGRIGGPVLDRMDIRLRVEGFASSLPAAGGVSRRILKAPDLTSLRELVQEARERQKKRQGGIRNGALRGRSAEELALQVNPDAGQGSPDFEIARGRYGLRAWHACLRMARTLADLEGTTGMLPEHLEEAFMLHGPVEPAPGILVQQ